jgi:nitrite reductase/ring-hydroxylating ferredoxin subunit
MHIHALASSLTSECQCIYINAIALRGQAMKYELCKVSDAPSAGSRVIPFFGREVHVYRAGDRLRAAANVCLHFGGPLECREGKLVCPWHGAAFDMASGAQVEGPAPKDSRLMFLPTRIEGDALYYVWGE